MAIHYSLIARGEIILAEHNRSSTNANLIARQILCRIKDGGDSNVSFSQNRFFFHAKICDGIVFLSMSDYSIGNRIPLLYLETVRLRFKSTYGGSSIDLAPAYAMNEQFSRIMCKEMEHYSSDCNTERIYRLKGEMENVKNIMIDNIDGVLQRGDRLAQLVEKTATMQGVSFRLGRQARKQRNVMWWRNFLHVQYFLLL